jgi:hypothetical protein
MEKKEVKQQHQSESITFRLDSSILNKLHHEAEQKDISINTLVSHIIMIRFFMLILRSAEHLQSDCFSPISSLVSIQSI